MALVHYDDGLSRTTAKVKSSTLSKISLASPQSRELHRSAYALPALTLSMRIIAAPSGAQPVLKGKGLCVA